MPSRRAGRAGHDPVREDAAGPRARQRRCRPSPGFNLIATANDRDRGVNELSAALRRRFNTVVLPLPADGRGGDRDRRAGASPSSAPRCALPDGPAAADEIRRVVTVFRELRDGVTDDGRTSLKVPSGTLSTAEAISVVTNGLALAAHFGDGTLARRRRRRRHRRRGRARIRCTTTSPGASTSRASSRDRDGWGDFYDACRDLG